MNKTMINKKTALLTVLVVMIILTALMPVIAQQQTDQTTNSQIQQTILTEHVKTRAEIKRYFEDEKNKLQTEVINTVDGRVNKWEKDIKWLAIKITLKLAIVIYTTFILAFLTWDIIRRKIYKKYIKTEQIKESPLYQKMTILEERLEGLQRLYKPEPLPDNIEHKPITPGWETSQSEEQKLIEGQHLEEEDIDMETQMPDQITVREEPIGREIDDYEQTINETYNQIEESRMTQKDEIPDVPETMEVPPTMQSQVDTELEKLRQRKEKIKQELEEAKKKQEAEAKLKQEQAILEKIKLEQQQEKDKKINELTNYKDDLKKQYEQAMQKIDDRMKDIQET